MTSSLLTLLSHNVATSFPPIMQIYVTICIKKKFKWTMKVITENSVTDQETSEGGNKHEI